MGQFDSVEHANELDHALQKAIVQPRHLQAISEYDAAEEETTRVETHNTSKKT